MGGEQAADVLASVKEAGILRQGKSFGERERRELRESYVQQFDAQSRALYASSRLWDDGIIDPRMTRDVLALSLSVSLNAPLQETRFGVFRM